MCRTFFILQLHLNPVHAVVQLRPSLDHLKPGGSKRKGTATGDAEVAVKRENFTEAKSLAPSKKQVLPFIQILTLYCWSKFGFISSCIFNP